MKRISISRGSSGIGGSGGGSGLGNGIRSSDGSSSGSSSSSSNHSCSGRLLTMVFLLWAFIPKGLPNLFPQLT